jgi:hypothetical protein
MTSLGFLTRATRRVSLVEEELLTLSENLSLLLLYNGVPAAKSLAFYVVFCIDSVVQKENWRYQRSQQKP